MVEMFCILTTVVAAQVYIFSRTQTLSLNWIDFVCKLSLNKAVQKQLLSGFWKKKLKNKNQQEDPSVVYQLINLEGILGLLRSLFWKS